MSASELKPFDPLSASPDLLRQQHLAQEIVFYGESRFRSILIAYNQSNDRKKYWMMVLIRQELVCTVPFAQYTSLNIITAFRFGVCGNGRRYRLSDRNSYLDTFDRRRHV
jgi:hypothetical protein